MTKRLHRSKIPSFGRALLIWALMYFGSVYPYLHIHHGHDESWSVAVSLHPPGVDTESLPGHHDDDHHPALRYSVGVLPLARQTVTNLADLQPCLSEFVADDSEVYYLPTTRFEASESPPIRPVWRLRPAPLRGPPALTS